MANKILRVEDISISFSGIKAVQHLSFELEQGEFVALIGPNGSGKSTTINMISGTYKPDGGKIYFDGKLLSNRDTIAQRSHLGIGRTFQTPKPFGNLTVFDNVYAICLQKYDFKTSRKKAGEILEMSSLMDLANTPSSKLSIEKRKWMDLARVLATEPKLIMMDEVMAGLNPNEMLSSLDYVREINRRGITILFVEHVMRAVVSVCTRAVVLNEGKFLYEGTPTDALNDPTVIAAYIGGGNKNDA
ncbi:MAG TPA: ABC transporter ATP-binding protein [Candidatus Pullichristensenella stercorigallinarum]|uniref:ABC transporter ATP-binding protein n=1 Tax=Candidatus Pullichristensenella stercorigallinarum TaxID=2840909 RepID=A0A9D0ZQJ7_9FIRM|nr:ABC transporter ATP-binding protein [Candidatus Pullichristensenella stercorigallinarum]